MELLVLGIRFIMLIKVKFFEYEGLLGEIYLDWLVGGIEGIYKVEGFFIFLYFVF